MTPTAYAYFKAYKAKQPITLSINQYRSYPGQVKYLYNVVSFALIFVPPECDDLRQTNMTIPLKLGTHQRVYGPYLRPVNTVVCTEL